MQASHQSFYKSLFYRLKLFPLYCIDICPRAIINDLPDFSLRYGTSMGHRRQTKAHVLPLSSILFRATHHPFLLKKEKENRRIAYARRAEIVFLGCYDIFIKPAGVQITLFTIFL